MREPSIKMLNERTVFSNRFATLFNDDVRFANGVEGTHLRLKSGHTGTGVLALLVRKEVDDTYVALVEQYRYPVERFTLEAPRGSAESTNHAEEVVREIAEETLLSDISTSLMGIILPDTGLLTTEVSVFLAEARVTDSLQEPGALSVDEKTGEQIEHLHWFTTEQLWHMVAQGDIVDSMTLAALTLALAHGHLKPPVL